MNRPADLVEIPPLWRTVLYYVIAEAIIVCTAVGTHATGWDLAAIIAQGNAVLFFGTAAAKVATNKPTTTVAPDVVIVPDAELEPLPSERRGYGSGVAPKARG